MSTAIGRVCPQCRQADRIQKVTSIIDSGSSITEIYDTKSPFAQGHAQHLTKLAYRLQLPEKWLASQHAKRVLPKGCAIGFAIFFLCVGFTPMINCRGQEQYRMGAIIPGRWWVHNLLHNQKLEKYQSAASGTEGNLSQCTSQRSTGIGAMAKRIILLFS